MTMGMGLYMGTCSGHGLGSGSSHHPGLGGGTLGGCPHIPLDPRINAMPVIAMDAVTLWPPIAQLPLVKPPTDIVGAVVVNGMIPILDQDILTPHPTPTQHTTTSTGDKCFVTLNSPAFWCTQGTAGGRELPIGHARKAFSTVTTVFVRGQRCTRFGDPLGDKTTAFPCNSVITGSSPNVFIEASGGAVT